MINTNLFTPDQAAEYVGLQPTTLAKLRSKGGGPTFVRVGGGRGNRIL